MIPHQSGIANDWRRQAVEKSWRLRDDFGIREPGLAAQEISPRSLTGG
jgi:hypothetical protein